MWALESGDDPGEILYSGLGQPDKVVGTYTDFNAGDGTSPVVSEYTESSEEESKTYEITVSGFNSTHEAANGNYWRTDPPANTHSDYDTTKWGVWTNGTYYIAFTPKYWCGWVVTSDMTVGVYDSETDTAPSSNPAFSLNGDAIGGELPSQGNWQSIIVTEYAG